MESTITAVINNTGILKSRTNLLRGYLKSGCNDFND